MKVWQDLTDMFGEGEVNQEMVKKYRNTILALTYNGKTFYATYKGVNGPHLFNDKEGNTISLVNDTDVAVTIPTLERGLYNTSKGAVFVTRSPYRQYRRGICEDNTYVNSLISIANHSQNNIYSTVVFDVLESKWHDLPTAFRVCAELGSAAITKQFAIQLHHNKEVGHALFYNASYIGDITKDTITIRNKLFLQEVVDTQRYWCPNHKIVLE
jgi:hypothetical protein